MKIKDVMEDDVEVVDRGATLHEAAYLMRSAGVGILPVVDDEKLVGLITDRDIIERAVAEGLDASDTKVRDVMSQDLVVCSEDGEVGEAERLMHERGVSRVLVVDDEGELTGVLEWSDLSPRAA
jgi:CBS domain-containing protein